MANFLQAFEITMVNEGVWGIAKGDSGGETYRGISRNNWPDWAGWKNIDSKKAQKIPHPIWMDDQKLQAMVQDFYKSNFWDHFRGDDINSQAVANEIFDTAVNMGEKTEAVFLQMAINAFAVERIFWITEDGKIGPQTIGKLNSLTQRQQKAAVVALNSLQGAKYIDIVRKNPSQAKFIEGWMLKRVLFNG